MAAPPPSMARRSTGHGEVYVGSYKRLESIGKGSFATVYKAVHPDNASLVAIKTVQHAQLSGKLKANLFSEIDILKSIKHPHIVALINILESANHIHLVMEFCQLGDLATFVKKRDKLATHPVTAEMIRNYPNPPGAGFNEVIVRHFSKQLSTALEFLRARNLVHRDLKPQNLLLNPPPSWISKERPENRPFEVNKDCLIPIAGLHSLPSLKIADFGFARHLPTTTMAETLCGSPLYMAPEILRYERYDAKADLWSVGTVLYELMVGKPPFRAANHVDLLRKIERTMDKIKFPDEVIMSDEMQLVIRALLKKMPTERMSWESFFQSAINTDDIPGLVPSDMPKQASVSPTPDPIQTQPLARRRADSSAARPTELQEEIPRLRASPDLRPLPERTQSNVPPVSSSLGRQPSLNPQRRPNLTSHLTAPAAQAMRAERAVSSSPVERPRIVETPSPGTSAPRETTDRERERHKAQLAREKAVRDARERAAQDVAFERDYVMVEKRAVEVNAFADELAASPQIHGGAGSLPAQPVAMLRRATTQGAATQTAGAQSNPARQMQIAVRPEQFHARKRSWEANLTQNKISATSAIAAALNTVNFRLTGGPLFPNFGKGASPPQPYVAFPSFPTAQTGPLLLADSPKPIAMDEDQRVIAMIEECATRSDVVYGFAEVKYKQLIPLAPSNDNLLGIRRSGTSDAESAPEDDGLTMEAVVEISEEALVLFVKTLAILTNTFNLAGRWWNLKSRGEVVGELSVSPRGTDHQKSTNPLVGVRINNVIQWARNRFNECLEKSEYVSRRLADAQDRLPLSHPGHPDNHPSQGAVDDDKVAGSGIHLSSGVTAEKLMYERALEMNTSAALNELMNDDLAGCEVSYLTAVRLLEAVLERDEEQTSKSKPGSSSRRDREQREKDDAEPIDGIEEADRRSVLNVIENTKQRLSVLRKKITMNAATRRNSYRPPSTSSDPASSTQGSIPSSLPARLSPRSLPH